MYSEKSNETTYPKVTLKTIRNIQEILKDMIQLGYEKNSGNKNQTSYAKGNLLAPRHK